ncbi:MAG: aldo/keto reductase [Lentisphaerae bacterium]|nr:aldo/keto reductase [Lentisphaerota bacterium]MBT4822233.1 aldo/keto reductase [Lentisphaerota bacterium]MBT5605063.1 aldo/keto reductase [Lentisphaerota bacterium]MBT7058685.1 aldo/keto reductase [Lentisphaerota bacterium]MBT7847026.1 aldo/keto reductase [Lentisphaerota bacterium]
MSTDRRDFLKSVALGAVAAGATSSVMAAAPAETGAKQVERRKLGKIGAEVSILGLGLGSAFFKPYTANREEGQKLLMRALEHGVNYWDTARVYQQSEVIIGPVIPKVRDRVFLVSKSGKRDYDGFMREIELSLKNLQTDHLDLYHIHNLNPKKDKDLSVVENGALKAARKAKEQGLIKNIGITGHSAPGILMEAIKRWPLDAILTVFPASRPGAGKYEDELLPLAREKNLGVIAMKTVRHARQSDLKGSDLVRYAMSLNGVHVAIVGLDTLAHLDANATMASDFKPMTGKQRAEVTRDVQLALGDYPAPWDMPGYVDGGVLV